MKLPDYSQYKKEIAEWHEKGEPLRSPERILEIFNICAECPHSIKITKKVRQCEICTCMLRPKGHKLNKIALATTNCPLPEPKWTAETIVIEPVVEPQPEPIVSRQKQPPKTGGCGCGL